ncbi:MAG: hypothetical protein JWR74_650 [Polaromonas sp.]|nr:hypothetical protein [Polaromonas sp.]
MRNNMNASTRRAPPARSPGRCGTAGTNQFRPFPDGAVAHRRAPRYIRLAQFFSLARAGHTPANRDTLTHQPGLEFNTTA